MLVTLTGPTCSGKSTLEKQLVAELGWEKLTSFTTRDMREGEVNGVDYYFMKKCPSDSELVEKVTYNGNSYGILKSEVEKAKSSTIVAVVEPYGASQLAEYCLAKGIPNFRIYVTQPKIKLVERFLNRFKNDSKADTGYYSARLLSLVEESDTWYNRNLFNTSISGEDNLVNQVKELVDKEKAKVQR